MTDAQAFILSAAKQALDHLQRQERGELPRGMYETILTIRSLHDAIAQVEAERAVDELFVRR